MLSCRDHMEIRDITLSLEPFAPAATPAGPFLGAFIGGKLPATVDLRLTFDVHFLNGTNQGELTVDIVRGDDVVLSYTVRVEASAENRVAPQDLRIPLLVQEYAGFYVVFGENSGGLVRRFHVIAPFVTEAES